MRSLVQLMLMMAALSLSAQELWQPYYISPRPANQHQSLNGEWRLGYQDQPVDNLPVLDTVANWITTEVPVGSVQWSYYLAGELPYVYANLNSKQYEWIEDKTWYYQCSFDLSQEASGKFIFLCFDGLDYFSRIWLNGQLLGSHEGMFGGPAVEVSQLLKPTGNELVVEVRSGKHVRQKIRKSPYFPKNVIKGWEFTGGSGAEPFYTVGIWQGVRLEYLPKVHMERPFLITKNIDDQKAHLQLKAEILVNNHSLEYQLHPVDSRDMWSHPSHGKNMYDFYMKTPVDSTAVLKLELLDQGEIALSKEWDIDLFQERVWVNKSFDLENPKLWWPNGMGDPNLYQARLSLTVNGQVLDQIDFDYGIRTVETTPSAGPQVGDTWDDWQFEINGKPLFIKGINWMPADVLLNLPRERYQWILRLAKDAGIQMVRIWGSGLIETEAFYQACNELGIMVWGEYAMANWDAPDFPQDVYESQVMWTLYRLRNHPSLVLHSGGNEYNPYSLANTPLTGILERSVRFFDGTRPYRSSSPDGGSIHTYPDMDPTWYKKKYQYVPYISETGMHSITDPAGLYQVINPTEFKNLGDMYSDEFVAGHPDFIHHFVEFNPVRVPRMLSRASHIDDMSNPSLESIAEATQVGAGEFYQVMSEQVQANYPITTGLMPWVFKRPWPVVSGIHLVDGFGQPSAPYYFLKRSYENLRVMSPLARLLWKPGETLDIAVKVLNVAAGTDLTTGNVKVQILSDQFEQLAMFTSPVELKAAPAVSEVELGDFTIPDDYRNRYFFILTELFDQAGNLISRSDYWPRTIPQMEEESFYDQYTSEPMEWPTLANGPWLKPAVSSSKTRISAEISSINQTANETQVELQITNKGKLPAFMTNIQVEGAKRLFVMDDSYFWLAPGEQRNIKGTVKWRESLEGKRPLLVVSSWNSKPVKLKLK